MGGVDYKNNFPIQQEEKLLRKNEGTICTRTSLHEPKDIMIALIILKFSTPNFLLISFIPFSHEFEERLKEKCMIVSRVDDDVT